MGLICCARDASLRLKNGCAQHDASEMEIGELQAVNSPNELYTLALAADQDAGHAVGRLAGLRER